MSKLSSCIAIVSSYSKALSAKQSLTKTTFNDNQVILLDKDLSELSSRLEITDFFNQISVQKDTMQCYLSLLQSGSCLLVTSGSYQDVEIAYQLLKKNGFTSSIHFKESLIKSIRIKRRKNCRYLSESES